MLDTNAATVAPELLGAKAMAQILAAILLLGPDVAAFVAGVAPGMADDLLAEIDGLVGGGVTLDELSPALRWILPEIHAEIGRRFCVAVA